MIHGYNFQALVYDILPPTIIIMGEVGRRKDVVNQCLEFDTVNV